MIMWVGDVIINRGLYAQGQSWLEREDIVGVARACVHVFVALCSL